MKIGVVGLGLIGGSIAKAIKQNTNYQVFGMDIQASVIHCAKLIGAIDGILDERLLPECDMVIVALYPEDTINYIKDNAANFKKGCMIADCGGVKQIVCEALREVANENDFAFVGCHPMAGIEASGFKYSQQELFHNASMLVTPYNDTPLEILNDMKQFWLKLGFSNITLCSLGEHDLMIAYTSQLAHVVSSAYVKSELASKHKGFSAGSFRDMTRVAKLNEKMWTELFFANPQNLVNELNGLIERLVEYRDALQFNERERVEELLKEGRIIRESIGD